MKSIKKFKNKLIVSFSILLALSCSDGEITISSIDFSEVAIQSCNTTKAATLFFKIKDKETIVLQIPSGLLKSSVSENTIESSIPSQSALTYRTFQDNISTGYFCDALPTLNPTPIKNAKATSGSILINTVLSKDGTSFDHKIQLSGVTFVDDQGKRITDLNINDFGTFSTPK